MQEFERVIDEYTLAAFLAGTLPEARQQEVIEYLAANPDAREVLQMAAEALEAARSGDVEEPMKDASASQRQVRSRPARRKRHRSWVQGAGRYVAATLFVFVVGIVLRLSFGPPTDALRSPLSRSGTEMQVDVSTPGPAIQWPNVANAYRYRIVIWDPQEARVAGEYETTAHIIEPDDSVSSRMRDELVAGREYALRIDAIDAQNRLVRSSETVDFRLE